MAQVPWWSTLITLTLSAPATLAIVRAYDARAKRRDEAQIAAAQAEANAHAATEREETARQKLGSRGFERAFEAKAQEHRECIEEVKGLRVEVVRNRNEIADVRVALARCEEQHEHAREERIRDRDEHQRDMNRLRADIKSITPPPTARSRSVNTDNDDKQT